MKLESVFVSPWRYEISYDPELCTIAFVNGAHNADTLQIVIDPRIAEGVQQETLLHEVLHAIWTQLPLDGIFTEEQEEQIIGAISPRLFAFLVDNKKVVKEWLAESY